VRKKKAKEEKPKTTKQLGVRVDKDQWRRFRSLAALKDRTAGDLLKEVLAEYLERQGKENVV
jgi:predicted transcriptional regulator